MNKSQRMSRLRQILSSLPEIECQKKCVDSCGPLFISKLEFENLGSGIQKMKQNDFTCPLLVNGLCSRHEARPAICRLLGITPEMKCPYGCVPDRWVENEEAYQILKEIDWLSEGVIYGLLPGHSGKVPRRVAAFISKEVKRSIHATQPA